MSSISLAEDEEVLIDGRLDERIWSKAPRVREFSQVRPSEGGAPSEITEVQIATSLTFIYVAFRVFDESIEHLDAKGLVQGQSFNSDDRVAVSFDTFNDKRNSYFFQVNANGVRRDALWGTDYFIEDWDAIWYAATKIYDWGWAAEFAIPVSSIAFDPDESQWGINFSRTIPRRGEEVAWSFIERKTNPSAFGRITSIPEFSQGKGVELIPSLSLGQRRQANTSESIFEPSFTSFYNITPNLTAGLTLNTDFLGTEADERRINLGRFSLFFPEKRDFFLRDASIFEFGGLETNARPFFSRRIGLSDNGDPLNLKAGLKLSGRAGDWNMGALLIEQDTLTSDAGERLFVGRLTRNVFDESEIGVIATAGDPNSDSENSLTGLDYTYRNSRIFGDQALRTNLWYQQSSSNGLTEDDAAYGARLSYPNYDYDGFLDLRRIETNFNPALGFVNRRGVDQIDSRLRRRFRIQSGPLEWLGARAQYFKSDRIGGGIQTERKQLNPIEGFSKQNDFFTLFYIQQTEGIESRFTLPGDIEVLPDVYEFDRYGVYFETGDQRVLSTQFLYATGGFFNGDRDLIEVDLRWRPNKHLFASVSVENNDIKSRSQQFTSRLFTARANVAFNSRWAWLNLIQGDNVSDSVSFNSRLRYQPRADRQYFLIFDQTRHSDKTSSDDYSIVFKASFNFQL